MALPAVRKPQTPTTPAAPAGDYSPGRIRHETDGELAAVTGLIHDFPEYAKLPHDAIIDAAAGFRTEERYEELARLKEAGVPQDWRPGGDDEDAGGGV
jgi:hypothetical protein